MAYEEKLAQRIRELVRQPGVTEKKMFGGLSFRVKSRFSHRISFEAA